MRVLSLGAIAIVVALGAAREPVRDPLEISTAAELEEALSGPRHDAVIILAPGVYELTPESATDPACGDCEDPDTPVPVTVGVTISGRNLRIEGPVEGTATIVTHAGYGLYFKDCEDCELEYVTVTGGVRDASAAATDAAIVASRSSVAIRNCIVVDNIGDAALVAQNAVGIMGICGREGSDLTIENCEILHNSWDGIALYLDARATICNNLVDGVDASGGHGAAIRAEWNAHAVVERNLVTRCDYGLGVFRNADVVARGNIFEGVVSGIRVWNKVGTPLFVVERNVVYDTDARGISVFVNSSYESAGSAPRMSENIVVHTAQDPERDGKIAYRSLIPGGMSIRGNVYYDNRDLGEDPFGKDTTKEMFWRERRGWVRTFRNTGVGVDGRVKFHQSAFLTEYPRWWD